MLQYLKKMYGKTLKIINNNPSSLIKGQYEKIYRVIKVTNIPKMSMSTQSINVGLHLGRSFKIPVEFLN